MTIQNTPQTPARTRRERIEMRLAGIGFLFLVINSLPLFSMMLGYDFLISPEWNDLAFPFAVVFSLAFGLVGLWSHYVLMRQGGPYASKPNSIKKRFFWPAMLSFAHMFYGYLAVVAEAPILAAIISGSQAQQVRIVDDINFSDRYCWHGFTVKQAPIPLNRVCHLTKAAMSQISSGTEIVVTGRGTWMGLFVESARRA